MPPASRAADLAGRAARERVVGAEHDVRIEHGDEGFEVALEGGGEKGVDHAPVLGRVGDALRPGAAHPAPCPARELAGGLRSPIDDRSDLLERDTEAVVEDEGEPFRRRERLEHDEQREADRVREQRLLLGVDPLVGADDRVGQPGVGRLLRPGAARPQDVQADAPDHGRQPAAEVLDRALVGAGEPQPGLLHCVLALVDPAEHPVGDPPEMRPVLLESLCEPLALTHPAPRQSRASAPWSLRKLGSCHIASS